MTEFDLEGTLDRLVGALTGRRWMLATAESCTGGWVAKVCTDRPGSSAWFERGYVTYSNRAKSELLGVDPAALEQEGAVSESVVRQMAEGLRSRTGAEAALAVSGIAGPDGGSPDKPVGTVWFAWSCGRRPTVSEPRRFPGDREAVRRRAVEYALQGLLRVLESDRNFADDE